MHMYKRQSSLPQYYRQSSLYERQSSDEDSTGSGPIHCTGAGPVHGNKPIHCAHNKPVRLDRVVRSCSVLGHLSSSTSPPSPETSAVSSPFCMRRRRTQTHCSLDELLSTSPPAHQALLLRQPSCVARDPIQPTSGTLNSSTEQVNDDEEEERDNFCAVPRQRSSTCPESRAWKRRLKVRAERRPASPPPCDVHVSLLSQQLSSISIKEQLSIPERNLPNLNEETADRDFPNEDSTRCFLIQCSNYMIVLCGIICDFADVKLCFSLQKPDFRLLCPESWELDGNCVSLCHVLP